MAINWKKAAKSIGKKWDAAKSKASEFGGQTIENGRYVAQVLRYELMEAASGRLQVLQEYKVTEGESKGEKVITYQGLDSDTGISFFLRSLKSLGYDPDGLEDCEDICAEINKEKPMVRITVRGKDDGFPPNIFVDKVLSAEEAEEGTEETEEAAGDEEIEIEVGMTVVAKVDGEEIEGKVVKVLESLGKIKVEDEDGTVHKVAIEDVSLTAEKSAKKGKAEKEEAQDLEDMDREELEAYVEKNDLDIDVDSKKLKDDDDLREAIEEAMDKGDKEEEEEEDEDAKPSKKKVVAKTGSLKKR